MWYTIVSLWVSAHFQGPTVSFREGNPTTSIQTLGALTDQVVTLETCIGGEHNPWSFEFVFWGLHFLP